VSAYVVEMVPNVHVKVHFMKAHSWCDCHNMEHS